MGYTAVQIMIEPSVLRTKSPFFIIAKNFFIFGLLWFLYLFLYGVFNMVMKPMLKD